MGMRYVWVVAVGVLLALAGVACGGDAAAPASSEMRPAAQVVSPTQTGVAAAPVATPSAVTATHTPAPAPTSVTVAAPAPPAVPTTVALSTPEAAPTLVSTSTPAPTAVPATAIAAPTVEPTPMGAGLGANGGVEPDPDYEAALEAARLRTSGWDTDFSLHTVEFSEIRTVIPRDNIPAIDAPKFVSVDAAAGWLQDVEPVVALDIAGDARAYPLQILTWHEIVNDEVGGVPVAVTFCPLCNSAIAFDRRFDGDVLDFGVSGNLRNSDLIMYDRQTHSWWQQFTGEGIVGRYAGGQLEHLPSLLVSFADFRAAYPEGRALSRDTGFARQYGRNPYVGYDTTKGNPFLFGGALDDRLLPVERVIAVSVNGVDAAFPLGILQEERVINYTVGGRDIVALFKFGAASALDAASIAGSRDVGSAAVFDANLNGRKLTFGVDGGRIVDAETGSIWSILGSALEGELAGESLTPLVHGNHFWFAWAAFKPDTLLYEGAGG